MSSNSLTAEMEERLPGKVLVTAVRGKDSPPADLGSDFVAGRFVRGNTAAIYHDASLEPP